MRFIVVGDMIQGSIKSEDIIDKYPTTGAVEVVRCEDCKYWDGECYWLECAMPDDYCSNGERREP